MKFDRKGVFITRCRSRARKQGCRACRRITELGVKCEKSLIQRVRSGASIEELKQTIRDHGWYCRKCVRKWKGTAAVSANLRDQFPPGPEGEKLYNRHRYEVAKPEMEKVGYKVTWDEEAGDFTCRLTV